MNYTQYNPDLVTEALSDDEQDQLEELLQMLPSDAAMDLECLDGYLTALLIAPTLPATEVWLPPIWGLEAGEPAPFASGKQLKRCIQLVLRYLAMIDRQFQRDPDALEPLFGVAEVEADEDDEGAEAAVVVDAEIWCIGFLQAMAVQPEPWDTWLDDPVASGLLAPVVRLGCDPDALTDAERTALADPVLRDALSRQVADAIGPLYRLGHPAA
jgi:uncharacterized protein